MSEQTREWRPSPEEVRRIVEEMRPILRELARQSRHSRESLRIGRPKLAS